MSSVFKNKVKILFPFFGDRIGGSHFSSLELIKNLNKDEFEPVIVLHTKGIFWDYLTDNKINAKIIKLPHCNFMRSNKYVRLIFTFINLPYYLFWIRIKKIKIIHTNDNNMHMLWGIFAKVAGVKFVWHQRNPSKSNEFKRYSKLAHKIITISEYCKNSFPEKIKVKSQVIINPFSLDLSKIDKRQVYTELREELGVSNDSKLLCFVGNLAKRKRPDTFIKIAGEIIKNNPGNTYFIIFGEKREPLYSQLKSQIEELDLKNSIMFMGLCFPIEKYMAGCDVLLAPAVREGFGRTLVEAMLVETPVIAADDGGHSEIITDGETGFLVEPDNINLFSSRIIHVLQSKDEVDSLKKRARKYAEKNFSAEKHALEIMKCYRDLLEQD